MVSGVWRSVLSVLCCGDLGACHTNHVRHTTRVCHSNQVRNTTRVTPLTPRPLTIFSLLWRCPPCTYSPSHSRIPNCSYSHLRSHLPGR